MNFADRLNQSIRTSGSVVCAGFDPQLEHMPPYLLTAAAKSCSGEEAITYALEHFHRLALTALRNKVAAIKCNIAFFETYGIPGLRAFSTLIKLVRDAGIPLIIDAKRGDIGNTASAYARAFLSGYTHASRRTPAPFEADAITLNPFLGFDTLSPFIQACQEHAKGIFVLVRTSNPGAADIQSLQTSSGKSISVVLAEWVAHEGARLLGESGFSALGAVVGATSPRELAMLREIMPVATLLIPGYGAQGGTAADIAPGFADRATPQGAVVNVSRALCAQFSQMPENDDQLIAQITERIVRINSEIAVGLRA